LLNEGTREPQVSALLCVAPHHCFCTGMSALRSDLSLHMDWGVCAMFGLTFIKFSLQCGLS